MPTTKTALTRRRRPSPAQEEVDSRALEIACRVEAAQEGHEDLCTERFKKHDAKIDDVKDDIQRGNEDRKRAMDELGRRYDANHESNSHALKEITSNVAALALQFGVDQGKIAGHGGFLDRFLKVLPILIATATLIIVIIRG